MFLEKKKKIALKGSGRTTSILSVVQKALASIEYKPEFSHLVGLLLSTQKKVRKKCIIFLKEKPPSKLSSIFWVKKKSFGWIRC